MKKLFTIGLCLPSIVLASLWIKHGVERKIENHDQEVERVARSKSWNDGFRSGWNEAIKFRSYYTDSMWETLGYDKTQWFGPKVQS